MKKIFSLSFVLCCAALSYAQDSLTHKTLEGITLSVSKWEQQLSEIPNKLTHISRQQVLFNNPQTAADMLGQSGTVFIQKSQLGGGSPMIRGFATNRVLLVVDGIRMNNAIYRSGNLQNVISIDPLSLESSEVIFGPGSLIYGSDAIGGVMDFHTLQPQLSRDSKLLTKGSAFTRYSTANQEKTVHADLNLGGRRLSFLASYTFSEFGDLKMGKHGPEENYLRPEYVIRHNNQDSIVKNADPRVQKFSGYQQHNALAKLRFKATEYLDLQYAFTYAHTGDAPRYDRLIQYRNGNLRFAEWYYGPMVWEMHSVQALFTKKNSLADQIKLVAGYQDYTESRNDRARNSSSLTSQAEHVDVYTLNIDANKKINEGDLFYGVEYVHNLVGSTGTITNINSGDKTTTVSRYPDGSTWSNLGLYASYKRNLSKAFTILGGLRYSYNMLHASFDTSFVKFPYKETELKEGALTGNLGMVFRPAQGWQINGMVSTGYRMPNVDDLGKFFESKPGVITVPNPDLKPEYAWNYELGVSWNLPGRVKIEINGFHTVLQDAIVSRTFHFNGQDSIDFNGSMNGVDALQNVAKSTVWGIQASARYHILPALYVQGNANWIWGEETDDEKNEQVAMRHAPPFYGSGQLVYRQGKWQAEFRAFYNGEIANKDMAPSERSKPDIYAKDKHGQPYSPSWYTLNAKASYQLIRNLMITAGWENITNQRYRPYSSGIVAAGSNFILSLRASF